MFKQHGIKPLMMILLCIRKDVILAKIELDIEALCCKNFFYDIYKDFICSLYQDIIDACLFASECIPNISPHKAKVVPGWNDRVEHLKQEVPYWHRFWKCNGSPHNGDIAELPRITRIIYHRAIKQVERDAEVIKMERMDQALLSNRSRDMWSEPYKNRS